MFAWLISAAAIIEPKPKTSPIIDAMSIPKLSAERSLDRPPLCEVQVKTGSRRSFLPTTERMQWRLLRPEPERYNAASEARFRRSRSIVARAAAVKPAIVRMRAGSAIGLARSGLAGSSAAYRRQFLAPGNRLSDAILGRHTISERVRRCPRGQAGRARHGAR
jgi:hypothetical protein